MLGRSWKCRLGLILTSVCIATSFPAASSDLVIKDIVLQAAEPVALRTPFEGRTIQIAAPGQLLLKAPKFPPGMFLAPHIAAFSPDPEYMERVGINVVQQSQLLALLRFNAAATINGIDDVDEFQRAFRANVNGSFLAIREFGQKSHADDYKFWEDFAIHAPGLASMTRIAYERLGSYRPPGQPLPSVDLADLKASLIAGHPTSDRIAAMVEDLRSFVDLEPTTEQLLRAISDAAFWDMSQNDTFHRQYYVMHDSSQLEAYPPNSPDLIDPQLHKIRFSLPRERGGIDIDVLATWTSGRPPPADSKRMVVKFEALTKFAAYWRWKAATTYFDYNDRLFLRYLVSNLSDAEIAVLRASHRAEYGDFADLERLITELRHIDRGVATYSFPIDPIYGLLEAAPVETDPGMSYLGRMIAAEADAANDVLLYRYSIAALIRCMHTGCTRPVPGRPGDTSLNGAISYNRELIPRIWGTAIPAGMPRERLLVLQSDAVRQMSIVAQFVYSRGDYGGKFAPPVSVGAWLINEMRKPVRFDGKFVVAQERDELVAWHELGPPGLEIGNRIDDVFIFSGKVGALQLDSYSVWSAATAVGSRHGDRWGVFRRLAGVAFGPATRIVSSYDTALRTLTTGAVGMVALNAMLAEVDMNNQLGLEAGVIRASVLAEVANTENAIASRQGGMFFLHDDGIVIDALGNKAGDYMQATDDVLLYRPIFEYDAILDRPEVVKPVKGEIRTGSLVCSGQIFGRSLQEVEAYRSAKALDPGLTQRMRNVRSHKFSVRIQFKNEKPFGEPPLWFVNVLIEEEDRYVPLVGLADTSPAKDAQYQNIKLFKDGQARLLTGVSDLACDLIVPSSP